ncbi:hypothetical protein [Streptomyces sp. NBC_00273]|uniref:hypothetical protein n=1 Tax=Streptomyces sp. NBC_00273 TaxID=2903644 RepID=UPI002E2E7874|nr:hypothetical protein [Streptomyces sp. NBC_00273]
MTAIQTALLLTALAVSLLLSLAAAAGAAVLELWDGGSVPGAVGRGLTTFAGTLTLCGALLAVLLTALK